MVDVVPFPGLQCRAARALLEWSQDRLATEADVGIMTVKRVEAGKEVRSAQASAIKRSLEQAGVVFLEKETLRDGTAVALGIALRSDKPEQ